MNNVNLNKDNSIKLLKNFIKDLSFENPQNINENNVFNNGNSNLNINMNVFYRPYNILLYNITTKLDINTYTIILHNTLSFVET